MKLVSVKAVRRARELYKAHRPRKFSEIFGNKGAIATLLGMLKSGTVPHTILIHGPSGTGKTTIARILREKLGCHDTDYHELNCSSSRGIDTIRDIETSMRLAPWGGDTRIWTLDEAHQLTAQAQHGALKILEDTPQHVYFILCTTEPTKLLKTIRNRCTIIATDPLRDGELKKLLESICKKAKIKIPTDVLLDIVDQSQGSARRALVLLDKVRNMQKDQVLDAIDDAGKEHSMAIDLCRALMQNKGWRAVAKILRSLKETNADQERIRMAVLGYARTILLTGKESQRAFAVLCAFEDGFGDNISAGLVRACYEATR